MKSSTSSTTSSGISAGGSWPVLARFPEVLPTPPDDSAVKPTEAVTTNVVGEYRFDQPESIGIHLAIAGTLDAEGAFAAKDETVSVATIRQPPEQEEVRPARLPKRSSLLPASDLFPSAAPEPAEATRTIVRTVTMLLLVTAAVVSIALLRAGNRPSYPTAVDMATPITGPEDAGPEINTDLPQEDSISVGAPSTAPAPVEVTTNTAPENDNSSITPVQTTNYPSYPSTAYPEPTLPMTSEVEAPATIARLPGYILEYEPRQAEHDDHESSVH